MVLGVGQGLVTHGNYPFEDADWANYNTG